MRIAVLGAGAGGCAAAAGLALKGHSVVLFNRSRERLANVLNDGTLFVKGIFGEHRVPVQSTTDLGAALDKADVALVIMQSGGHEYLAESVPLLLKSGQTLVVMAGYSGSLLFAQRLGSWCQDRILLGETTALPFAARVTDSQVVITLPMKLRLAAFPSVRTKELHATVQELFPCWSVTDVLDVGLNNPNIIIHPLPVLLNYGEIERKGGDFSIRNEGTTPTVLACMDALDNEKIAVCRKLGYEETPIDKLYLDMGSNPEIYRKPHEPMGIRDKVHPRFIEETCSFGLSQLASVGEQIGEPTPIARGVVALVSAILKRDVMAGGRTAGRLGLEGLTVDEIREFLRTGYRKAAN